jgi:DNA-directed RNA polymerase subunit RPC12/RpoP
MRYFFEMMKKQIIEKVSCTNCGRIIDANDNFCANCGTKMNDSDGLDNPNQCTTCDHLNTSDNYCRNCGKKLKKSQDSFADYSEEARNEQTSRNKYGPDKPYEV